MTMLFNKIVPALRFCY